MKAVAAFALAAVWGASTALALAPTGPRVVGGPVGMTPAEMIQAAASVVSIISTVASIAYTVVQIRHAIRANRLALRDALRAALDHAETGAR
jgi:hypothetical protein